MTTLESIHFQDIKAGQIIRFKGVDYLVLQFVKKINPYYGDDFYNEILCESVIGELIAIAGYNGYYLKQVICEDRPVYPSEK